MARNANKSTKAGKPAKRQDPEQTAADARLRATPVSELPYLLTVDEWRRYANLSRSAAYAMVKAGKVGEIPVVRIDRRHVRIPRTTLEQTAK